VFIGFKAIKIETPAVATPAGVVVCGAKLVALESMENEP
jgi:hypothetical protein